MNYKNILILNSVCWNKVGHHQCFLDGTSKHSLLFYQFLYWFESFLFLRNPYFTLNHNWEHILLQWLILGICIFIVLPLSLSHLDSITWDCFTLTLHMYVYTFNTKSEYVTQHLSCMYFIRLFNIAHNPKTLLKWQMLNNNYF